ncbi:hypothetical protein N656DRAFT_339139 [Canariomyces notabilis]|uniref:Uncharacterized protein n=1 Tax=Canariomyces notabilis TaxID=2074819 RepID=A0AAN6T9N0_9PEZI|nr:hypothetical protein N656DRAFT_339139 [Canariomyces arenarius]
MGQCLIVAGTSCSKHQEAARSSCLDRISTNMLGRRRRYTGQSWLRCSQESNKGAGRSSTLLCLTTMRNSRQTCRRLWVVYLCCLTIWQVGPAWHLKISGTARRASRSTEAIILLTDTLAALRDSLIVRV